MKNIFKNLFFFSLITTFFIACEKDDDEGGEMDINFKTGSTYTSSDDTLATGTAVLIGIEAETEKSEDPIIRFNISESINNGDATTVYSEDLENQSFEYYYAFNLEDTVQGNRHKYVFTITNRDGFNAQKSLTLTVE